jgi:hypothetical protein
VNRQRISRGETHGSEGISAWSALFARASSHLRVQLSALLSSLAVVVPFFPCRFKLSYVGPAFCLICCYLRTTRGAMGLTWASGVCMYWEPRA